MIARIKTKYGVYDSFVFAYENVNYKERIVVIDENYELICLDCWTNHKINYMIIDYNINDYQYNFDDFKCYWKETDIFKVVSKKKYSEEMLDEAIKINESIQIKEWINLENENDFRGLMASVYNLHDACVVEVNNTTEYTEILIDTTCNMYIKLRCYDVIRNDITNNDSFFSFSYEILEDRVILSFDNYNNDEEIILEAKKIEFKLYHEFIYKFVNYEFLDNCIRFINKEDIVEIVNYDELKLIGKNVGTINIGKNAGVININSQLELTLFLDDYMLKLINIKYKNDEEAYKPIYDDISSKFNEKGIKLNEIDYWNLTEPDYGEILYKEEYSKFKDFLESFKILAIISLFNMFFWLLIDLITTENKMSIFLIFGIGISVFLYLISIIIYLVVPKKYNREIIVYEKGIL